MLLLTSCYLHGSCETFLTKATLSSHCNCKQKGMAVLAEQCVQYPSLLIFLEFGVVYTSQNKRWSGQGLLTKRETSGPFMFMLLFVILVSFSCHSSRALATWRGCAWGGSVGQHFLSPTPSMSTVRTIWTRFVKKSTRRSPETSKTHSTLWRRMPLLSPRRCRNVYSRTGTKNLRGFYGRPLLTICLGLQFGCPTEHKCSVPGSCIVCVWTFSGYCLCHCWLRKLGTVCVCVCVRPAGTGRAGRVLARPKFSTTLSISCWIYHSCLSVGRFGWP